MYVSEQSLFVLRAIILLAMSVITDDVDLKGLSYVCDVKEDQCEVPNWSAFIDQKNVHGL